MRWMYPGLLSVSLAGAPWLQANTGPVATPSFLGPTLWPEIYDDLGSPREVQGLGFVLVGRDARASRLALMLELLSFSC